jgi:hypothetical protein
MLYKLATTCEDSCRLYIVLHSLQMAGIKPLNQQLVTTAC